MSGNDDMNDSGVVQKTEIVTVTEIHYPADGESHHDAGHHRNSQNSANQKHSQNGHKELEFVHQEMQVYKNTRGGLNDSSEHEGLRTIDVEQETEQARNSRKKQSNSKTRSRNQSVDKRSQNGRGSRSPNNKNSSQNRRQSQS